MRGMTPWATPCCCQGAPYPAGPSRFRCRSIRNGNTSTRRQFAGSYAMASTFRSTNLFFHVSRDIGPSSPGLERARSATEAFFYRRLETLPETAGRFQLNAELPIPFDGWGKMEVDLLCSDARLVS